MRGLRDLHRSRDVVHELTESCVIAWPSEYGQALQVADLHADAR